MPFVVGETVGPYRIVEQLGKGGMATVFKAYHAALDRYVALKAMHPAFLEDPNFLARFQREAQVVAKLDHPHIVPIFDYAEHEGRPYLVMKYISGETLKARLARGPLTLGELRAIVQAIGAALSYAHQQGILHRDIKPSNVLLAEGEQIYLADFGLARIAQSGPTTLSSDMMLGTPQYISPEQAMGKSDLGVGTDIYSFGVMLYEIVVGQVPFSADTPYSIIHDHIYTPLPLPRERNPRVPRALERVLLKALSKEPDDRFPLVDEMAAAFDRALLSGKAAPDRPAEEGAGPDAPGWRETLAVESPPAAPPPVLPVEPPASPEPQPVDGGAEALGDSTPEMVEPPRTGGWRRRWRWWYLAPLLAGLCVCALALQGLMGDQAGGGSAVQGGTQAPATAPSDRPPPELGDDPLAVAQQNAAQHPDDPFARMELAAALYEAGLFDESQAALQEAGELAGGDPGFYAEAGGWLAERELWLLAAGMFLPLANSFEGEVPQDIMDQLELSIYLAAAEEAARPVLGLRSDRVEGLDPLLVETARARFQLYHASPGLAQTAVNGLLERHPDYAPAQLLQAEILVNRGQVDPALRRLEELAGLLGGPAWVPAVAQFYLDEYERNR